MYFVAGMTKIFLIGVVHKNSSNGKINNKTKTNKQTNKKQYEQPPNATTAISYDIMSKTE